jgi:hypothetical protein
LTKTIRLAKRAAGDARYFFLWVLLLACCNPMRGCPESELNLRPGSRLPRWFSLPAGLSRDDVNVKVTFYATQGALDDAVMELVDQNGRSLATATGQMCWHPVMLDKVNPHGGLDQSSFPAYVIITVHGITEVTEQFWMEPFFGVTDDPMLVVEANESVSKGECRKEPSESYGPKNRKNLRWPR